jgi:predicted phage terminase large subunit-like protein
MRLRDSIDCGDRTGIFKFYPIENSNEIPLWSERFPDHGAIKKLERKIADPIRFEREYRLRLIPDEDQIICWDDVHYYDQIPPCGQNYGSRVVVGVDLAISQKDHADFTAMLQIMVRGYGEHMKFYVLDDVVNKRMDFNETIQTVRTIRAEWNAPIFFVETIGYQEALVDALSNYDMDVRGYKPNQDKRARLNMISRRIKNGQILFPRGKTKDLLTQLVGFGIEKHDDLVDALTCAVIMTGIEYINRPQEPEIIMVSARGTPFARR